MTSNIKLIHGECIEELKKIKDGSVDLVLIDPPYNINKEEWDSWKEVDGYVAFMRDVLLELQRVLKKTGSFYFFHNDFHQISKLQNMIDKDTDFIFKSFIVWNKPNYRTFIWRNPSEKNKLRSWFNINEYCLFYTFEDKTGGEEFKTKLHTPYLNYMTEQKDKLGWNRSQFNKFLGYSAIASHWFWQDEEWTTQPQPSLIQEKDYIKLQQETDFFKKPYSELMKEHEEKRKELEGEIEGFEKQRYTFNKDEYHNNLWVSKTHGKGKLEHSCQKPTDLLERIIKCSSNEGDVVLDCFLGSGSTGVAAKKLNRDFIGIEREDEYFEISKRRINDA